MDFNEKVSYIEKIFDENGNEIHFSILDIRIEKRKHSKTFSPILYIDSKPLTGKQMKSFYVQYICRCNRHIKILLQKYIKKEHINCMHCLQDRSFENHVKTYPYSLKKGLRKKIEKNEKKEFDEYSKEFKESYKKNHLSSDEFFHYLSIIEKINNEKIENKDSIKYKYHENVNNQSKFSSKISVDGKPFLTLKTITLKCSVCGKEFNIHPFNIRLQYIDNLLCRHCKFNNLKFPIKKYNDSLTYQSLPELKFIELCIENNIQIMNGFEIPYYFKKKDRTYIADFYLPEYKYIIEIKSRNPYYKEDLMNGKAEAKGAAACNFGKQYGMKYKLVFDYDIENFIKNLKDNKNFTIL